MQTPHAFSLHTVAHEAAVVVDEQASMPAAMHTLVRPAIDAPPQSQPGAALTGHACSLSGTKS
jgi:hypothetical protein